ncbi:hypothetical protein GCM10025868_31740 [Angustibacter aerolatus]|uniref:Glycosyltransferase 2-like domain-containing protein n=1 Tax=Angustibacter aerolatus TaxID=1162965 RepID=A0ABQ6JKN5_9ACTN|nr:hypothetical protein GCM10025868_31740 [Angustibacter aerolatus]
MVADDGSPQPPDLGDRPYRVRLVRQADDGFRAAAARNLGAAASTAPLLLFVDGDTVPEPGYVAAMAAELTAPGPARLVVGRRRHADLTGWTPDRLAGWLTGAHDDAPASLAEPRWLLDAFERTDDLRLADATSYRFVLSAVLGLPRALFERVGGFEASMRHYGGEDQELANRCWLAGADLRHCRAAVAWHDGPEFAERDHDDAHAARRDEGLQARRAW